MHQGSERQALKDVSLTIQEGECVLLCGKSGCGKNPIEAYVPVVGSVFQNPKTQYFNTNTTTELAFPCENMGMHSDDIRQRIAACARKYKLEKLLDRNIFHLSGGEKQRIACGAATMLEPMLLVLDEPTSNLDQNAIRELHDMLKIMKQEGVTIVLVEHRIFCNYPTLNLKYAGFAQMI